MRFPGFDRQDRAAVADPAAGQVYVERRHGESAEHFEARLATAARERAALHAAPAGRRPVVERRTERPERRRKGHGFGLVGLMVVLVAAVGALWLVLAAREGSFAAGGAVVDRKLAEFTGPARVATNEAVDRTGAAVQTAGQSLEAQGQRIRETAQP
jgi:hypothetical protein